jgi:predicted peptidase
MTFFVRYLAMGFLVALPLAARADKPKGDWKDLLAKKTFTAGKEKLPYRLMKPQGYDKKKTYPLVVFLHGSGERGIDNNRQLVHGVAEFAKAAARKKYPCFLIAPQCPANQMWVDVDWSAKKHKISKEPSRSGKLVLGLIDEMKKEFSIDPKRIYLTGLSMGGYGTWDLLARKPALFAAGVPICGGGDEKTGKTLAKIPIWVFHGDKDNAVNVERSREMVAAIKKAGGKPKYTEYKGVGHNSWTRAYNDPALMKWLFKQKRE